MNGTPAIGTVCPSGLVEVCQPKWRPKGSHVFSGLGGLVLKVLYQASRAHSVSGKGAILLVAGHYLKIAKLHHIASRQTTQLPWR